MPSVLMLVATSVATDTRVRREATTLVGAGYDVHIIGKEVPVDFVPDEGVTVSSVGSSSVFRGQGGRSLGSRGSLPPHVRLARWLLLPEHRRSAFGRWAAGALEDGRRRTFDVVHVHDFTALQVGHALASERRVPLVYDTHEYWQGRAREHRPTPLRDRTERRLEQRLGGAAAAVITVGTGVAAALGRDYGWSHVEVVRNSFPAATRPPPDLDQPTGALYAGRLADFRDLATVAHASVLTELPLTLMGPADETWLAGFDPRRASIRPPVPVPEVTALMREQGIALVTVSDAFENNQLAMPNKIFHAVHAGVPVVATDVSEISALIQEHGIGLTYRPGDAADLARTLDRVAADYSTFRAAVAAAQPVLNWDHDSATLLQVYDRLFRTADGVRREVH